MYLDECFDYKNQFMQDILTNETIVKLLTDDYKVQKNPKQLVYSQVFPYEYLPETIEEGKPYIFVDVDIKKSNSKTFWEPYMYVWVLCHKSKLKLTTGGVRTDRICAEIAKAIDGSRFYGLGELELYSVARFSPTADHTGKVMTFHLTDFHRTLPTGKDVPVNRKLGK